MAKVFISHSSDDNEIVKRICDGLEKCGVDFWVSFQDIKAGDEWNHEIELALNEASHVLVIMSQNSLESKWVQAEWQRALEENKVVIPAIIGKVTLPIRLSVLQAIELVSPNEHLTIQIGKLATSLPKKSVALLEQYLNRNFYGQELEQILNRSFYEEELKKLLRENPSTILGSLIFWFRPELINDSNRFAGADIRIHPLGVISGKEVIYDLIYLSDPYEPPTHEDGTLFGDIQTLQDEIVRMGVSLSGLHLTEFHIRIYRGRRSDYSEDQFEHRQQIEEHLQISLNQLSNVRARVDIISYTRLLEQLKQLGRK